MSRHDKIVAQNICSLSVSQVDKAPFGKYAYAIFAVAHHRSLFKMQFLFVIKIISNLYEFINNLLSNKQKSLVFL